MKLKAVLQDLVDDFARRHGGSGACTATVEAEDSWRLRLTCDVPPRLPGLCLRSLTIADVPTLIRFGAGLGPVSKDLFCPYPWADPDALQDAYGKAVQNAATHTDASYLVEAARQVIGHCFLWKAGGNPLSQPYGLEVPELGIAIVDAWQGLGLGTLCVQVLQAVARDLGADAIELTTAMTNGAGWNTYRRCGFEYTGIIRTPLDVDVTASLAGEVQANRFRDERQMVYVIRENKRRQVLDYLATKRADGS